VRGVERPSWSWSWLAIISREDSTGTRRDETRADYVGSAVACQSPAVGSTTQAAVILIACHGTQTAAQAPRTACGRATGLRPVHD
jgi:hypothetical protein